MKLYFGNMVTTVTTLMILSLVGFVGYSISNRGDINFWGRRSLFVLAYGLVICCFAAAMYDELPVHKSNNKKKSLNDQSIIVG